MRLYIRQDASRFRLKQTAFKRLFKRKIWSSHFFSYFYLYDQNKYILGVSKTFNNVDHNLLIDKLNLYSIKSNSLKFFLSYLSNRKQFLQAGAIKTSSLGIICGVPQQSILGPLNFIIHVNDLCNVPKIFKPIRFTDDTSLFLSHKSIKDLFHTANLELYCLQMV